MKGFVSNVTAATVMAGLAAWALAKYVIMPAIKGGHRTDYP